MLELSVGIVGAGKGGSTLIETLSDFDNIKIEGIADINHEAPGLKLAIKKGIECFESAESMLRSKTFDVIFEVTGDKDAAINIRRLIPDSTALVDGRTANIMLTLIKDREELLKIKETKEQLAIILNSAQEGIQLVDKNGIIQYVNEGYTRITGIPANKRIGCNVFDVSQDGALVEVLRTGKPCMGKPNRAVGSNAQVISNAAPVIVNGEMTGAVVVFQDISEVIRLTKELKKSSSMIDGLKTK